MGVYNSINSGIEVGRRGVQVDSKGSDDGV
jgi:hypothetical protein